MTPDRQTKVDAIAKLAAELATEAEEYECAADSLCGANELLLNRLEPLMRLVESVGGIEAYAERLERSALDVARYRWLRSRDLDAIHKGGVFAGLTPSNLVVNGDDLDAAIDAAMRAEANEASAALAAGA